MHDLARDTEALAVAHEDCCEGARHTSCRVACMQKDSYSVKVIAHQCVMLSGLSVVVCQLFMHRARIRTVACSAC